MPPKTKRKKAKLRVRRHVWRPTDGKPRTEVFTNGRWIGIDNLQAARLYAQRHGYTGIAIQLT